MCAMRIVLERGITSEALREYAATPGLIIDITAVDPRRLPPVVAADIWTEAAMFLAPNLRHAKGNIFAPHARRFYVPRLRQVDGHTNAQRVKKFTATQLIKAGDINIRDATAISVPILAQAGYIVAPYVLDFAVPRLVHAGHLLAPNTVRLSAPLLESAGNIEAQQARIFNVPKLVLYENLMARPAVEKKMAARRLTQRVVRNGIRGEAVGNDSAAPVRQEPRKTGAGAQSFTHHFGPR